MVQGNPNCCEETAFASFCGKLASAARLAMHDCLLRLTAQFAVEVKVKGEGKSQTPAYFWQNLCIDLFRCASKAR
ncbi:hypothetical protein WJX82_005631 [Trebouxia sp. C0006]